MPIRRGYHLRLPPFTNYDFLQSDTCRASSDRLSASGLTIYQGVPLLRLNGGGESSYESKREGMAAHAKGLNKAKVKHPVHC